MVDEAQPNGGAAPGMPEQQGRINVLTQYIKDMSFETPNAPESLRSSGQNPNLQLEVGVNARNVGDGVFESAIRLNADATTDTGVLYKLELVYAGAFRLENIPQGAVEPVLLIECPRLLFPFVRRLVADTTREGGFPPVLLDPMDFAAIYAQNARAKAAQNAGGEEQGAELAGGEQSNGGNEPSGA